MDDENNLYILESDEQLLKLAASEGITTKSTVVVTGDSIFACHYAVILKYLGIENVYVMSGGANSWTDAGYQLETKENTPTAVSSIGVSAPKNADVIDTTAEIQTKLGSDKNFTLVDTRRIEEYRGEISGYSYITQAGRIEGSVFGQTGQPSGINSSSVVAYSNLDSTMRNADEIKAMWKASGIDTSKHLSFYCGGGYRAAEVYWTAQAMGLANTSNYNDGWSGWVVAGLPYVTGN